MEDINGEQQKDNSIPKKNYFLMKPVPDFLHISFISFLAFSFFFYCFQSCNLSLSQEHYERFKNMVCVTQNGAKFDHLIFARGLLQYGMPYMVTYSLPDGRTVTKPLLRGKPKFLFRSLNEIISITFQFQCPNVGFCPCQMSKSERKAKRIKGEISQNCPWSRKLKQSRI